MKQTYIRRGAKRFCQLILPFLIQDMNADLVSNRHGSTADLALLHFSYCDALTLVLDDIQCRGYQTPR
jgi:hypothetical protein